MNSISLNIKNKRLILLFDDIDIGIQAADLLYNGLDCDPDIKIVDTK